MNKHDLNNKIFVSLLLIISCFFLICLFRNSKTINYVDNRNAYKFTIPTLNSLLTGEYQNKMDETIADQMPKYNYFKLLYLKITNYTNIGTIKVFNLDNHNKYIKLGFLNLYNNHLVYTPSDSIIENSINEINKIVDNTNSNIYLYFINTDSNYNFETGYKADVFSNIKGKLNINNISSFDFKSFDEYKKYFYKTDHHWNYEGSYKGYNDLVDLMNLKKIDINGKECLKKSFFGSKIRDMAGIKFITEDICVYNFELPEFEIYISNKKVDNYGHTLEEMKLSNEMSYAYIYGADYDEIKFVNNESDNNKKLLIYSNSFSNAINKLLASNYKETYIIDGRYYNKKSMIDYINENEIDDVLFLTNNMLFQDKLSW